MGAKIDLTGQVFNRLTVLNRNETREVWSFWDCECSCGNRISVLGPSLRDGDSQSCGCLRKEISRKTFTTHGMTDSEEYSVWKKMWARCTDPNNKSYPEYKDRTPPPEWRDFEVFYKDMGPRPSPQHSIDRIKNNLPYGPGNCKWSTPSEQSRNRSYVVWFEVDGKRMTQTEYAKHVGVSQANIIRRRAKQSIEEIISYYKGKE